MEFESKSSLNNNSKYCNDKNIRSMIEQNVIKIYGQLNKVVNNFRSVKAKPIIKEICLDKNNYKFSISNVKDVSKINQL